MDDTHPLTLELPSDELGGASGASYFHVLTIGKRDTREYPYTVVNEKIASELGRAIGLRIPEVLLYPVAGNWYCFSHFMRRTESGETVPAGTAREIEALFAANPIDMWCDRISQIPSYFIQAVIDNLPPGVLNSEERGFLCQFVEERKLSMRSLIEGNPSLFPALRDRGGNEDE